MFIERLQAQLFKRCEDKLSKKAIQDTYDALFYAAALDDGLKD